MNDEEKANLIVDLKNLRREFEKRLNHAQVALMHFEGLRYDFEKILAGLEAKKDADTKGD